MTDASTLRSVLSDAELILATRAGDGDAYGELYVRHLQSARAAASALTRTKADADDVVAEAFSRVLGVLQRGGGPDISFRPYLLTTIRNSFYERSRKVRLDDPTDEIDDNVNLALLDMSASQDDRALVASAFAGLPERWQLVLWHTEVEGRSAAEVAPLLGIAANAVAALAYRAREGLREAYLQSHLQKPMADACQSCVANLGGYVRDSLPARDRRRVDEHLATCTTCPPLLAELSDANTRLRAVLIPLIVGVPAAKYLAGLNAGKGLVGSFRRMPRSQQTMVGTIAASLVAALVLVGLAVANNGDNQRLVSADSEIADVTIAAAGSTADSIASSSSRPSTTIDEDAESDDSTNTSDPFDTVNTTASNTLPATDDTVDIVTFPAVVDQPVIPQYVPPTSQRTTPTTKPRATPTTTRPVIPTSPTQPAVEPTYPTVQPTVPTTPATEPTTPPTPAPTTSSSTTTTVAPVIPAAPQVGAEIIGRAIKGGKALIRINAANGTTPGGGASLRSIRRAGPATTVTVSMPLPTGVGFDSVDDQTWKCSATNGTLNCDLPALADQQKTSADIKLSVGPAVTAFSLAPAIAADGAPAAPAGSPLVVPVDTIADSIMSDYDTGSVVIIGNSNMTCNDAISSTCLDARTGTATIADDNNRHTQPMIFVDTQATPDSDLHDPFNSSTATLALGSSTVTKAYLVWGGDMTLPEIGGDVYAPDQTKNGRVRLTGPDGLFHDIDATTAATKTWTADNSIYSAYADVTPYVTASGEYQVADIQAATGHEGMAGWSLIVVTHNPADPMRLLTVTVPDKPITGAGYSASITLGPRTAPRPVTAAVASFEGDAGNTGDTFSLGGIVSPSNAFNASVIGAATPTNVNNFGIGSNVFTTMMTGTNLELSAASTFDAVQLALVAVSADL